jgi:4-hydroxybenzoate polyprenyltransferase
MTPPHPATTRPGTDIERPLCVDLDGTLIKTDLLLESLFALIKRNPLYLVALPLWLARGKAYLKSAIARRSAVNVAALPYNLEFLQFLTAQYQAGRQLILATAADTALAERIAKHLGIFSGVLASDGRVNVSGTNKLAVIRDHLGSQAFDYAGNAQADFAVWQEARSAILVNTPRRLARRAGRQFDVQRVFVGESKTAARARAFIKAIRVHQWIKNSLVLVPLLTSHKVGLAGLWLDAAYAFVAFSLCSSSVYLLNDLLDLEADRLHPKKRLRPFASGDLSLMAGIIAVPVFLIASSAIAVALLPPAFQLALVTYFGLTLAYSFYLKQIVLLDVLVLAMLYTLRIIAGAAAIVVPLSQWLLAFSLFLFLSLALVKRFSELHLLRRTNNTAAKGRGYLAGDLEQLSSLGAASGYISVLVLALYINSREVSSLYSHPAFLWLICPFILYWVSRVWLLAHRGQMHHDPIVFALKDKSSYLIGVIIGLVMLLAI